MSLKHIQPWQAGPPVNGQSHTPPGHVGHAHFWHRAMSRRQFFKVGAAATAVAVGSRLWMPEIAHAAAPTGAAPNPIPGGTILGPFGLRHFYFPTANPFGGLTIESGQGDPATITDFNGFVGVGEFTGGTGTGTLNGQSAPNFWAADVRFMTGEYIGVDGRHRQGTFAFV